LASKGVTEFSTDRSDQALKSGSSEATTQALRVFSLPGISLQSDATSLGFPDGTFDAVYSFGPKLAVSLNEVVENPASLRQSDRGRNVRSGTCVWPRHRACSGRGNHYAE
jgi:hypothetical protein